MRVHRLTFGGLLQLSEDTLPTLGETLRMKELQTCLTLDPPQKTWHTHHQHSGKHAFLNHFENLVIIAAGDPRAAAAAPIKQTAIHCVAARSRACRTPAAAQLPTLNYSCFDASRCKITLREACKENSRQTMTKKWNIDHHHYSSTLNAPIPLTQQRNINTNDIKRHGDII